MLICKICFQVMEMCLWNNGGVGRVCVLRESMCVTIITTGIHIHKLLHFANRFMSHLFFFLVISFWMPTLKMMGIMSSFKLKKKIQVNRTYKIDCLLLDTWLLLKDTPRTIQGHFPFLEKKNLFCPIISFVFICTFWFISLSLIIKHTFLFLLIEPIFCLPSLSLLPCRELYYWFKYLCSTPWSRTVAWGKENNT